jgi:hypothetical protein
MDFCCAYTSLRLFLLFVPRSMDTIHMSEITDLEIFDKGSSGHIYRGNWCGTTVAVKQFLAATLTQELVAEMYREQSLMKLVFFLSVG